MFDFATDYKYVDGYLRENYIPSFDFPFHFTPTSKSSGEWRKARIKNWNLPILQFMYNGDEKEPLKCMISGASGWKVTDDFANPGKTKTRFTIDFNHVRQKCTSTRQSGTSLDKSGVSPSDIFRGSYFSPSKTTPGYWQDQARISNVVEFLTIMPVSTEYHSYITQDSAKNDITLSNFKQTEWIWALRSKDNFNEVQKALRFKLSYDWLIDHMSDISHDPICERIEQIGAVYYK